MALQTTAASIVGNLIDNYAPLPDGSVQDPFFTTMTASGVSSQATASPVIGESNVVTNNTTTNGVILPIGLQGQRIDLVGALAAAGPIVYPPLGGTLNFGAVNAGVALVARTMRIFKCIDNTGLNWVATA